MGLFDKFRRCRKTTNILPADVVPTDVLPTDVLPTDALPTDVLPTDVLSTDVLPTNALPTGVLPTAILPTDTVVFIVGPSGPRKGWFMKTILRHENVHVGVSEGQKPGITEVHAERCRVEGMESDIVVVDVPASEGPDGEEALKKWMDSNYTKPCKTVGMLCFYDLVLDHYWVISKYLGAFRRTCRPHLVPGVIHVVPALPHWTTLSNERMKAVVTQLQHEVNYEGAQLCNSAYEGRPFDGQSAMAWDVLQELLAHCNNENNPASSVGKAETVGNDSAIFVLGSKGVDRSWFIRQLSENYDMTRHPFTKHVASWSFDVGSENIMVIETPSFHTDRENLDAGETSVVGPLASPSDHEDTEAKIAVTNWLKWKFIRECHPGVLYLHPLDSDPMPDEMEMSRCLESLAKTLPNNFTVPSRVYVVPTSNPASTLPSETLSQRLTKLETMVESLNGNGNCDWYASVLPGIFKGQPEAAWNAMLMRLKDIAGTQRMPPQHPNDLKGLTRRLFTKFKVEGRNGDLDAMIMLGRTALDSTPTNHPQHQYILTGLADLLTTRFGEKGTKEDLDELIMLRRTASKSIPTRDAQEQRAPLELDNCLYERFRRKGSIVDLEEIISLRRAALKCTPQESQCKPLLSLADSLCEMFQKQHEHRTIEEAISLAHIASGLCPPGHPGQALSHECLARYLKAKVRERSSRAHPKGAQNDPLSSGSSDIKNIIRRVFFEISEKFPPRLLHTPTGVICNRDAQLSYFEGSHQYKRLLSSISSFAKQKFQTEISDSVIDFFQIAMLSHRWGSGEPLLRENEGKKIYDLRGTDGLAKLQDFCLLALERNFQWAWSDTCCIDKDSSAELQEAIGSMFSWYHQSSLTIVYLSDVFDTGSLAKSAWFTRGWTLQELLASHTVFFYTCDWSLCTKRATANHKTDPAVLEELQKATGVAKRHLMNFSPGVDDARSRLHWASHRRTTRPEDIAYSLFGIFKVHLPVLYGESAENALGRLLAEIISRSGDVSVLDWVGEPSSFNSCFPANLVPYREVPHIQLIPNDPAVRNGMDLEKTQVLYNKLAALPRAGFVNNKLTLPSIIHQVTAVRLQSSSTRPSRYTYEIHASRLMPLEVTLTVSLDEGAGRYLLVRPWHRKALPMQIRSDDNAVWKQLEQLRQPFNALLLKMLRHNEYMRIASDCTITACVQDLASILDTEVLVPEIV